MRTNPTTTASLLPPSLGARQRGGSDIRGKIAAALRPCGSRIPERRTFAAASTRTQRPAHETRQYTTDNSPQTNHIKNITSLFPCDSTNSSVCGSCTAAPDRAQCGTSQGLLSGERPSVLPVSRSVRSMQRRRDKYCVRAWWRWGMPDQDELDAMTKAWTYAVLDALEAADETTRLEIARILCPAGFVIVPAGAMELPKHHKN